jgi:hypothetical protein
VLEGGDVCSAVAVVKPGARGGFGGRGCGPAMGLKGYFLKLTVETGPEYLALVGGRMEGGLR